MKAQSIRTIAILTLLILSFSIHFSYAEEEPSTFRESLIERVEDLFSLDDLRMIDRILENFRNFRESSEEAVDEVRDVIDGVMDRVFFWRERNGNGEREREDRQSGEISGVMINTERSSVEGVKVYAGQYSTFTDGGGRFSFVDLPFGEYEVHYQIQGIGNLHEVATVTLSNDSPAVQLQVIVPEEPQDSEATVHETVPGDEALDDEIREEGDERESDEGRAGDLLMWGGLLLLLLTPLVIFLRANRKQVRIIDLSNGEELGALRLKGKKIIWADLGESIASSGGEGIRVLFIQQNTKRILGKKLVFTNEEHVLKTIEIYTGEQEVVIDPSMIQKPEERENV